MKYPLRIIIVTSDIGAHRIGAWMLQEDGHEVIFVAPESAESVVSGFRPQLLIVNTGLPAPIKAALIKRLRLASSEARVMEIVDGGAPTDEADSILPMPYSVDNFAEEAIRLLRTEPE
jgi:DNA-binding response OmpR family regulator